MDTFENQSRAFGTFVENLQQRMQNALGHQTLVVSLVAAQTSPEDASVGMHCFGADLEDYIAVVESALGRLKAKRPSPPEPDLPDGFVRWLGGSHGPDTMGRPIRVRLRDGDEWVVYNGAESLNWQHYTQAHGSGRDIIGYKILGEGEA